MCSNDDKGRFYQNYRFHYSLTEFVYLVTPGTGILVLWCGKMVKMLNFMKKSSTLHLGGGVAMVRD